MSKDSQPTDASPVEKIENQIEENGWKIFLVVMTMFLLSLSFLCGMSYLLITIYRYFTT